jgi:hypothetical protein
MTVIQSTIGDDEVSVVITHFHYQPPHKGSAHTCDSDVDFYGYTECEFTVLDASGDEIKEISDEDKERIEQEITEHMLDGVDE